MSHHRAEGIVIRGGRGLLRLCQGDRDSALLYQGQPVVLLWSEPEDSTQSYMVRAHDLAELDDNLATVELHDDTPIADALRPVLDLLDDGAYDLVHTSLPDVGDDDTEAGERPRNSGQFIDWAGLHSVRTEEVLLVGTMPGDLVDRSRILDLTQRIRAGARPAVVALVSDEAAFVVAGHAALEAYRRLDRSPNLVAIEPHDPSYLSADEGADLLVRAYERVGDVAAAHYRAVRAGTHADEKVG